MSDLDLKETEDFPSHSWRSVLLKRYILKKSILAVGTAAILLAVLPGTALPASVSTVQAAVPEGSSSTRVEFQVNSLIPTRQVDASMNQKNLEVHEDGYQKYSVDVKENGYLLLEITSVSGMKSSQGIDITGLDDEAPHIVSHHMTDGELIIYLTDQEGSGVDYENITAYIPDTGETIKPSYLDEAEGYIALPFNNLNMYIRIPDKGGNEMTAFLQTCGSGQ